jgi:hypothetical protein
LGYVLSPVEVVGLDLPRVWNVHGASLPAGDYCFMWAHANLLAWVASLSPKE